MGKSKRERRIAKRNAKHRMNMEQSFGRISEKRIQEAERGLLEKATGYRIRWSNECIELPEKVKAVNLSATAWKYLEFLQLFLDYECPDGVPLDIEYARAFAIAESEINDSICERAEEECVKYELLKINSDRTFSVDPIVDEYWTAVSDYEKNEDNM